MSSLTRGGLRLNRFALAAALAVVACSGCSISHAMLAEPDADTVTGDRNPEFACAARESADSTVRWFGPEREGDRRALARWCATVGPPVVHSEPTRELPPLRQSDSLRIVTWNVHVGSGDFESFLREELGYRCDASGGVGFESHFVLLAQEVFRAADAVPEAADDLPVPPRIEGHPENGHRVDIVRVAGDCGLALFYVPSMRNGREPGPEGREDRGSAILSTLPLSDLVAVELPLEAQRRVTPIASVTAPGEQTLRVASVHLDVAGNLLRVLGTGGSMRVRQAAGLVEVLDTLDPTGSAPIVVAGDMNTISERETVILRMVEVFPQSPPPGLEDTRKGWPADHLFYRQGESGLELVKASYEVLPDAHGSDHQARAAILTH